MFLNVFICTVLAYLSLNSLQIVSNCSRSTPVQVSHSSEPDNVIQGCTESMKEEALVNVKKWRCKPRDQIVKLEIPNTTYAKMVPTHVRIRQCGGTCTSSL